MKILVLGIGQSLRGDDAAGLEAVGLWQATFPQTARRVGVETAELPGLNLLTLLDGRDAVILVDAAQTCAAAGTVIHLGPDELSAFSPSAGSAHGWGVAEALHLGLVLDPALAQIRVTLIGIVGKDFSMGAGLSPEIQAALVGAVERIEKEVQYLL